MYLKVAVADGRHGLREVAGDDGVADGVLVELNAGSRGRKWGAEVDAQTSEAAQPLEGYFGVVVAEEGLEGLFLLWKTNG